MKIPLSDREADALAKKKWGRAAGARRWFRWYLVGFELDVGGAGALHFGASRKSYEDAFEDADRRARGGMSVETDAT